MSNGYDEAREALAGEDPLQATVENLRRLLKEAAATVAKERSENKRLRERDRQWEAAVDKLCATSICEGDDGRCGYNGTNRWQQDNYPACRREWSGAPEPLEEAPNA